MGHYQSLPRDKGEKEKEKEKKTENKENLRRTREKAKK